MEWNSLELYLTCFDFREVKNVIDDDEQRLSGAEDGLGKIALLIVECGLAKQFAHAYHAIHGRTDFMAHIG